MNGSVLFKCLVVLACLVVFCAVLPLNAASDNGEDLDDNIGDGVDIHTFSYLSQIVYDDMFRLNYTVNSQNAIPRELHSLAMVADFYKTCNIPSDLVQTTKENLRYGDIVQLNDEEHPFLIYLGVHQDNIYLADINDDYYVPSKDFDLVFTGDAVVVNHTVNTSTIDHSLSNTTLKRGLIKRTVNSFWKTGTKGAIKTWSNNKRIRGIARNTLGGRKGTYRNRAWRIWCWMREGTYGGRHMYFHCTEHDPLAEWWMGEKMAHWGTIHTVDQTLDAKHGNCVEQARLVVGLARYMGCRARYVVITGHVWAQISETGGDGPAAWIDMETTRPKLGFGEWQDHGHEKERRYPDKYDG